MVTGLILPPAKVHQALPVENSPFYPAINGKCSFVETKITQEDFLIAGNGCLAQRLYFFGVQLQARAFGVLGQTVQGGVKGDFRKLARVPDNEPLLFQPLLTGTGHQS
jgi:hypothetical protein